MQVPPIPHGLEGAGARSEAVGSPAASCPCALRPGLPQGVDTCPLTSHSPPCRSTRPSAPLRARELVRPWSVLMASGGAGV